MNHNITTLFTYNNKGEILSNSEIVRNDIEDILNLNAYHLQQNRQKALTALKETINKKYKNTNLKGRTLVAIRDSYQRSDNTPYVGILLFYLEKKINQRR